MNPPNRKPDWLRVRLPTGDAQAEFNALKDRLADLDLHTVCEEARCPNIFECWGSGTATIMILGETCTRGCRFCAVATGHPGGIVDPREPENVAVALAKMELAYVVLTMVDRDDLMDGGARHVAATVQRIRSHAPMLRVETLVGDFQGVRRDVATVVREGGPDVFSHNVEVVPRLTRTIRDARCSFERSLDVLRWAKDEGARVTKSSLMLGLGESRAEVEDAMAQLRDAGVDVVTLGQYLRPTPKHAAIDRYVHPDEFEELKQLGKDLGFAFVAAGPLVRSSYRAAELFLEGLLGGREDAVADRYGRKRRLPLAPG